MATRLYRVVKTADETVTNTTTKQDDDSLTFSPPVSSKVVVDGFLIFSSSAVADIAFDWTLPTGATMDWAIEGETDATLDGAGVGTERTVSFRGSVVMSSTAGAVTLKWAQGTAEATNTTVHAGSALTAVAYT